MKNMTALLLIIIIIIYITEKAIINNNYRMRQDLILLFKIFMNALIYTKCIGNLDVRPLRHIRQPWPRANISRSDLFMMNSHGVSIKYPESITSLLGARPMNGR
jgi:hypothetical protein